MAARPTERPTLPGDRWSADPRELLAVGEGFSLADVDRGATPGWDGKKKHGKTFLATRGEGLADLQERLFAEARTGGERSVLLIVQGLDTSGKGGIARHVMGLVDPQGVQMRSFGVPTDVERAHHFLWRIKQALPTPGHIGFFDRSHYEDVLVGRVEGLAEPDVIERRYGEITRFEKRLTDAGTVVVKVALTISADEQAERLLARIDNPDKRWKYNPDDLLTRRRWDDYQEAYQIMLERTSTRWAPWHVIPADRKWYARLSVAELLARTLKDMDLTWPTVRWHPDVQRRRLAELSSAAVLREEPALREALGTEVFAAKEAEEAAASAAAAGAAAERAAELAADSASGGSDEGDGWASLPADGDAVDAAGAEPSAAAVASGRDATSSGTSGATDTKKAGRKAKASATGASTKKSAKTADAKDAKKAEKKAGAKDAKKAEKKAGAKASGKKTGKTSAKGKKGSRKA